MALPNPTPGVIHVKVVHAPNSSTKCRGCQGAVTKPCAAQSSFGREILCGIRSTTQAEQGGAWGPRGPRIARFCRLSTVDSRTTSAGRPAQSKYQGQRPAGILRQSVPNRPAGPDNQAGGPAARCQAARETAGILRKLWVLKRLILIYQRVTKPYHQNNRQKVFRPAGFSRDSKARPSCQALPVFPWSAIQVGFLPLFGPVTLGYTKTPFLKNPYNVCFFYLIGFL